MYSKKNYDTKVNSYVVAFSSFFLYLHVLVLFLEYYGYIDLGLVKMWNTYNHTRTIEGFKYIFNITIIALIIYFLSLKVQPKNKITIFREVIAKSKTKKIHAILYSIFSLVLTLYSVIYVGIYDNNLLDSIKI